jgi:hypothetical protein
LRSILEKGAMKAALVANETVKNVYEAMGAVTL